MSRTSIRYSKWKIFFDGVEMPWISFSVQSGRDMAGSATINLVYDSSLFYMRPETLVHIFMYDVYEESTAELDRFKLWWEGKIDGVTDSRSPLTRMAVVQASGLFSIFAAHKAFMSGFGPIAQTYLVTGSSLTSEIASAGFQLIDTAIFGKAFNLEEGESGQVVPFRKFTEPVYSERLLKLIAFFASHNSLLRMRSVRTNLFGKLASISDQVLTKMVTRSVAVQYFNQAGYAVDPGSSIADIINLVNQRCFYSFSSMTAPKLPEQQPSAAERFLTPSTEQEGSIFDIPLAFYRNDYIFMPETLYAIPPACNLIFPEFIDTANLARVFESEPTRALIVDEHLGSNLAVMSPESIFRFEDLQKKKAGQKLKPEEMWAINTGPGNQGVASTSPYVTPEGINLLSAVTDAEIEKGIIPATSFPSLWLFSGLTNLFDLTTDEGKDKLRSYLEPFLGTAASAIGNDQEMEKAYLYLMKSIADYTFTLAKFRRQASVTLHGHRWLVPGLPAVILLENSCYLCVVLSHAFSVDPEGQETSSVAIDYVRPLPSVSPEYVSVLEKIDATSEAIDRAVQALQGSYGSVSDRLLRADSSLVTALERYESDLAAMPARAASSFARRLGFSSPDQSSSFLTLKEQVSAYVRETRPVALYLFSSGVREPLDVINTLTAETLSTLGVSGIGRVTKTMVSAVTEAKNRAPAIKDGGGKDLPDFGDSSVRAALDKVLTLVEVLSAAYDEKSRRATDGAIDIADISTTYPFPPIFANEELINVESAETLYEGLIGSQKVFTGLARDSVISPIPQPVSLAAEGSLLVAAKTRQAYSKFVRFVQALKKLFPIDPSAVRSTWSERSKNPDAGEPVRDWEEREILRRKGLQSLTDFLSRHGLDAKKEVSSFPTQITFYVMKPVKEYPVKNPDGVDLVWDDTIFSKVVDERQIATRDLGFEVTGILGAGIASFSFDPEIRKLRESVKEPFLTTKARQEFLIRYARTHFGSRAHGAT